MIIRLQFRLLLLLHLSYHVLIVVLHCHHLPKSDDFPPIADPKGGLVIPPIFLPVKYKLNDYLSCLLLGLFFLFLSTSSSALLSFVFVLLFLFFHLFLGLVGSIECLIFLLQSDFFFLLQQGIELSLNLGDQLLLLGFPLLFGRCVLLGYLLLGQIL